MSMVAIEVNGRSMEPVFAALVGMYNRALEALSDGDAPPPFVFTYTPDAFLFG